MTTMPRIVSVLLAFFVSACGTTAMYDGPKRSDNELALIKSRSAYVISIDGREVPDYSGGNSAKFQVLPGQHTLLVGLNDGTGYVRRFTKEGKQVSFIASAGNSYVTVPIYGRNDSWKIEVVKEETNRAVTLPPENGLPSDDRLVGLWQGQRNRDGKCSFMAWKMTRTADGKFDVAFFGDPARSKLISQERGRWEAYDGTISLYSDGIPSPDVYRYTFIGSNSVRLTNVKRDPSADCMADYEFTDHRVVE
jgi:hypothetical protein